MTAPALRTWSIAEYLARRGHEIVVAVAPFGGAPTRGWEQASDTTLPGGIELWRVAFDAPTIGEMCRALNAQKPFAAAVATSDIMCASLAQAHLPCPIWLDFNGHLMAERQMLAAVHENDDSIRDQWNLVVPSLLWGDRFSTCSEPQRHALLGELLLAGRINERSDPERLVINMPPVIPSVELKPTAAVARGRRIPQDAFIVLWTGGYNTWTDVDTLFEGLRRTMEREPRLYYVSTGGAIEGHNIRTFQRFEALIAASPLRERFVMAGWVPLEEVRNYYAEADVAVNIDADTIEGRLGHRNRITEWILAGTPVVSTALSAITQSLAAENAISVFSIGDAQGFCDALLAHHANPLLGKEQNQRARAWIERHYAPDAVYAPLAAWAADPKPAPDTARRGDAERGDAERGRRGEGVRCLHGPCPSVPVRVSLCLSVPGGALAKRLEDLWRRPPAAPRRKPFGFGLGIKPRIEKWLEKVRDRLRK
ncbi:MAG: glycosyltransferase family 4 protein [Candidatus Sumerlaeota bacterium]|nr:glycosyltransferase family 4 protein [Candidatus Sumerlaeota bacterium]